ncbi:MAG: class I SAM-dependent methyltransferase [Rhodoluna sp.]|nr:class I SAM-dependent methyltransferase [Rhodoluna sp.]
MVDKISSWKYTEDLVQESDVIRRARARADELGVEAITPSVGMHLSILARALSAKAIVEVGTGVGVSGLWLLSASANSVLATIETESEHQNVAKVAFEQAGIASSRLRLINGRSVEVLTNLADKSYDLVFLDGDRETLEDQVLQSHRLLRSGGVLVISHALWRDRVPDTALSDESTIIYRNLIAKLTNSEGFISTISPIGDGLIIASKL